MQTSATRLPLSAAEYCACRRGSSSRMYACEPNFSRGICDRSAWTWRTVASGARRRARQTLRSVSLVQLWDDVVSLGRSEARGSSAQSRRTVSSGLKPAKSSKGPRATAISGLWFESVNWSGSWAWSLEARALFGWSWRVRALSKERICCGRIRWVFFVLLARWVFVGKRG